MQPTAPLPSVPKTLMKGGNLKAITVPPLQVPSTNEGMFSRGQLSEPQLADPGGFHGKFPGAGESLAKPKSSTRGSGGSGVAGGSSASGAGVPGSASTGGAV